VERRLAPLGRLVRELEHLFWWTLKHGYGLASSRPRRSRS
jgi:hypothetical protein